MSVDDISLVEQARTGDRQAFGILIERHYDLMFRLAFRLLGRKTEAEDLAQDICVSLPAKLTGFRGDARFSTWLTRVVLNAAKDALRKRASHDRAAQSWGEVEQMQRAEATERAAAKDWLTQAMARLAPDLRETVALTLGEDLTHAAAAEILGVSEGTVSWRMSEVRKALRDMAEEEEMLK